MKNRWNHNSAASFSSELTSLRAYTSRLLGEDTGLVLHGGGNTSVKGSMVNVFGEEEAVLFVKGSGWDLRTIEAEGFAPVRLDYLSRLGRLDSLSDSDMMKHLRLALLDPKAPTPSVEAILHALIPHKFVDHTHADAVVTISNSPGGEDKLRGIFGDEVLILPYIMPGFVLAKQVAAATKDLDWQSIRGIVLLHHGIFTFNDDAKASYDTMIELVSKAEDYLDKQVSQAAIAHGDYTPGSDDALKISQLRFDAGRTFGGPCLIALDSSDKASGFAGLEGGAELASRGPLTPDHTIHAKAFAASFDQDLQQGLENFTSTYTDYFNSFAQKQHHCLDQMPRYGVWKNKGLLYFAANAKRLQIVRDITQHTIAAIQQAEVIGGWEVLSQQDLFDVEYWELEQAKLKASGTRPTFDGKVAVVSGAASGIGKACVERLLEQGAAVIGLDVEKACVQQNSLSFLSIHCDMTSVDDINRALQQGVFEFGGIDMVVSNAGSFPVSSLLETVADEKWQSSLDINLSSHMKLLRACIPYLKNGFDPSVVFVGSKNVPAPGPGAAAYSVAKAGLAQMARVAALELGEFSVRVNTVHPNAVYDTAIWTDEVLDSRARHYGLTVEEYKTNNVLKTEVSSRDVAEAVTGFLGTDLLKTTGAQLPVDGGNERVI